MMCITYRFDKVEKSYDGVWGCLDTPSYNRPRPQEPEFLRQPSQNAARSTCGLAFTGVNGAQVEK